MDVSRLLFLRANTDVLGRTVTSNRHIRAIFDKHLSSQEFDDLVPEISTEYSKYSVGWFS
jgi:hypothetical protein